MNWKNDLIRLSKLSNLNILNELNQNMIMIWILYIMQLSLRTSILIINNIVFAFLLFLMLYLIVILCVTISKA